MNVLIAIGLVIAIIITYNIGDNGVKTFLSYVFAATVLIATLTWLAVMVLGGAELLCWTITGNFFHFM